MNSTILITGAPGNVGTQVVKGLTGRAAFRIAAFDVESAKNGFGAEQDIVPFDFLRPETFDAAFAGIKTVFLVRPPALSNVKRDIAPALSAAVAAGVTHIVFLSLQGVEQNHVTPHYKIEQLLLALGVTYTFLRCSFFMQNLSTTHQAEIRDRNIIAVPVGHARTSFIDVRDIGAVAARVLTEPGHENKIYTLTGGAALDYDEVAQIMTRGLGRPIRYTDPSALGFLWQQLRGGRPFAMAAVMTALYTITRWGNASETTGDVAALLQRPPTTFDQFVQDYRMCWLTP